MTLTDKIRRHLSEDIPQLLEDIETFTNMKIPRELVITDQEAYNRQTEILTSAQRDNTTNLKKYIERYIDIITNELIKDLARNGNSRFFLDTTAGTTLLTADNIAVG